MLCKTLDEVEDELTGIPNCPENWATDGRLYPPLLDHRIAVSGRPGVYRWRSKGHHTYIRENGAILIVTVRAGTDGEVVFEYPGADGKGVER